MFTTPVYLDNNATTATDPRVVECMLPYFTKFFGNPASRHHAFGWEAAEAVDIARMQIAHTIGAEQKEIIFTSGATESNNLAIKGVFEMYAHKGQHIITCCTEHKAVLDTCKSVEKKGGTVTYLPVKTDGLVDLNDLEKAIQPTTILIAIMYANNETGVIQPIAEIGEIAKKHGILFFCDGAQAVGKIPVNVMNDHIDLLSFTAHKINGPKGIGALFVRRKNPRVTLAEQINGGGHERGIRSGTLNVPGIVGFEKALELYRFEMKENTQRITYLKNKLETGICKIPGTRINGHIQHRLPNTTNIQFDDIKGERLMTALIQDMAISAGAACTSASPGPSHVLTAMGLSDEEAHASLRFSLGKFTTEEEIDFAISRITEETQKLRMGLGKNVAGIQY
ncbi:MAG: aminotransferase class V-fold PLP-dependent enzyme [Bacteroidetes bacterium]|nr:aminotransferase class V-fold PLP-dependent enzyme [Bacteroidota bacterium]